MSAINRLYSGFMAEDWTQRYKLTRRKIFFVRYGAKVWHSFELPSVFWLLTVLSWGRARKTCCKVIHKIRKVLFPVDPVQPRLTPGKERCMVKNGETWTTHTTGSKISWNNGNGNTSINAELNVIKVAKNVKQLSIVATSQLQNYIRQHN